MKNVRLWTIQPAEVYDYTQKNGSYRCLPAKCPNMEDFLIPYQWLTRKMTEKMGSPPQGIEYPVWAWHTYAKKRKKPDLRRGGHAEQGLQCVCMEIEVPDDQVVLSDFSAWHFVLNDAYLNPDCFDTETSDRDDAWLDTLPEEERAKAIWESRDAVFLIQYKNDDWLGWGEYIQATFWELKAEQIRKVQVFKARQGKWERRLKRWNTS